MGQLCPFRISKIPTRSLRSVCKHLLLKKRRKEMPTFNQLVKQGRTAKTYKSKALVLQQTVNTLNMNRSQAASIWPMRQAVSAYMQAERLEPCSVRGS